MAKSPPYMPFYPQVYLADDRVKNFTAEQHGAYFLLMCHMWQKGGWLPDDDPYLAGLSNVSLRKWRAIRQVLIGDHEPLRIVDHDLQHTLTTVDHERRLQPILNMVDPDTWERFIVQKKLFEVYENSVALIEKKRVGGRNRHRSPEGQQKDSSNTPEGQQQESAKSPPGEQQDSSGSPRHLYIDQDTKYLETPQESPASPDRSEVESSPVGESSTSSKDDPTTLGIIRDLTAKYRDIAPQTNHLQSDWSIIGGLYRNMGADAVLAGIRALAKAQAKKPIDEPIAYVGKVARTWNPTPAMNGHSSRDRPTPFGRNRTVVSTYAQGEDEP